MLLYRFLRLKSTPRQRAEPLKNAQIRRHGCGFGGFRGRVHLIIVGLIDLGETPELRRGVLAPVMKNQ
jgi:hypothetical protein